MQEEQDRFLELSLQELGDDETAHVEVRRGDDALGDTVEQLTKAAAADELALGRELTVSFAGEDGEDAGGLLKEFCQVRPVCEGGERLLSAVRGAAGAP